MCIKTSIQMQNTLNATGKGDICSPGMNQSRKTKGLNGLMFPIESLLLISSFQA